MVLALLLVLLQDKVEMKDFQSSYLLQAPASYSDRASWPAIVDLGPAKDPAREPGCFVITPGDRQDEAYVLACLMDAKTRVRIQPDRVAVRGGLPALALALSHPELFSAVVLQGARPFTPPKKSPACLVLVGPSDPDRAKVVVAAMVMKKSGIDVEVREASATPGSILEALGAKLKPRGTIQAADEVQRQGRYLDASLLYIDLLDNPELEKYARTKLKSIEGAGIMELAKVEIAMADRKYKDAILRCREAARQFSWVPPGERIRKRLAELELRPEVKRALELDD